MRRVIAEGLVLEPQVADHAPEMFTLLADTALYEYENAPPESQAWLEARFRRLESRRSADGRESWLNWVVRKDGRAIGYVQATIATPGQAGIAYVFGSPFWGRGLARRAVEAMIEELRDVHQVTTITAVLKAANLRSLRLLQRLGFAHSDDQSAIECDEVRMRRELQCS